MGKPQDIKFKNGLNVNGISLVDKNGKLTHPDLKSYTRDIVTNYNDAIVSRCKGTLSRLANTTSGMMCGKGFGDSICHGGSATTNNDFLSRLSVKLNEIIKNTYGIDLSQWSYVHDNYGMPSSDLSSTLAYFAHTVDVNGNVTRSPVYDRTINGYKIPIPFATLTTGVNDRFHLTYVQFERAYRMAVKMVLRTGIDMVCMTEPPEMKPAKDGFNADPDGTLGTENSWTDYYKIADIIRRVAADEGASLVDVHKAWMWMHNDGVNISQYYHDYVHPNELGYDMTADMAARCLTKENPVSTKRPLSTTYNVENGLYALFNYTPSELSAATDIAMSVHEFPYTARNIRDGVYKCTKIDNGGYATFNFPDVPIYGVYVAIVHKQTASVNEGIISIELNGATHATTYNAALSAGNSSNEFGYIFPYEGNVNGPVKVKCTGGAGKSVYVIGVTVLQPLCTVKHDTITGSESVAWNSISENSYSWKEQSTVGATVTLKWFGTDLNVIANKGADKGKLKITNDWDGATIQTIDLYSATTDSTTVIKAASKKSLGWHTTVFEVAAKNASSAGNKVQLRDCRVYGAALQDGTVFAMGGSGVTINCPDGVNHIETSGTWEITNNGTTVTASNYAMTKCMKI